MKSKKRFLAIFCSFVFAFSSVAFAHSGRTDAYGGHHDYKNVSGLGSYHYHHGYSAHLHPGGVCPYSQKKTTTVTKPTTTTTSSTIKPATQSAPVYVPPTMDYTSKVFVNGTSLAGPFLSYNNNIYVPLYQIANSLSATMKEDVSTKTYTMTYDAKSWYMDEFVVFISMEDDPYYHKFDCPVLQQNGLYKYLSIDIGFAELGAIDSVSPCPYCIQ